MNYSCTYMW